jgi:ABC-type uncharacterized transport system permease subunit
MGLFDLLRLIIVTLYLLSTLFFLCGVVCTRPGARRAAEWLAVAGFALHTLVLTHFLVTSSFVLLPRGFYIRVFSWGTILVFFLLWWRLKAEFLALIASPVALLVYMSSLAMPGRATPVPPSLSSLFLGLHIGALFLGFGLLAMAFAAGVLFIHQNRKIKSKSGLTRLGKEMPSLNVFDRINHLAVVAGFPLFTLGLAFGFFRAAFSWQRLIFWISLCIWFLFAFLFHQRLVMGWRGRKPAILAIVIFLLVVAALGVTFILPTSKSFHP